MVPSLVAASRSDPALLTPKVSEHNYKARHATLDACFTATGNFYYCVGTVAPIRESGPIHSINREDNIDRFRQVRPSLYYQVVFDKVTLSGGLISV